MTFRIHDTNCEICGMFLSSVYVSQKYCRECSAAYNKVRSRSNSNRISKERKEHWENLSNEEQLKRIALASKYFLAKEEEKKNE